MGVLWNVFQCLRQTHDVPDRIAVLLKDLIAFRRRALHIGECNVDKTSRGYISVLYHNKAIDMVNLPTILNSKYVRDAVPNILHNTTPPIVSFKYTKTIAGRFSIRRRWLRA